MNTVINTQQYDLPSLPGCLLSSQHRRPEGFEPAEDGAADTAAAGHAQPAGHPAAAAVPPAPAAGHLPRLRGTVHTS